MADDFELDDFELDEATLRQIEEEARRSVEAEFALDTDKLKVVESDEKSFDLDFDLDGETLRQIEREALESVGLDPDTDLELVANVNEPAADGLPDIDDFIPEISADVSAEDILPPSSGGDAVARAATSAEKAKAKAKAKHVALAKAHYTAIARRTSMANASSMVVAADPKDSKTVMLVVGGCLAVLILMVVIVALITNSGRDDGAAGSEASAVEQPGTAKDGFAELKRDIRRATKVMTPENFKAAIEKVEAYKAGHPEEADKCDAELARLQHQLNFVSGGATDP